MKEEFLWTEKYRPRRVKETILPEQTKKIFQEFVDKKNVQNLLLTGTAGTGKTTVAKAMLDEIGADYLIINGSLNMDKATLKNDIANFASTMSFVGGRKYVILDEADYLNITHVQPGLRNFMEEYSGNCGFIFTCNFPNKIMDAIKSRCAVIDFKITNQDKTKLAGQFHKRCCEILKAENVEFDPAVVAEVIKKFFPDNRKVLGELQKYSQLGKIDTGILASVRDSSVKEVIKFMQEKDFTSIRKWCAENSDISSDELFSSLYKLILESMTPVGAAQATIILAKYQEYSKGCSNLEINNCACLTEIMIEAEWQ